MLNYLSIEKEKELTMQNNRIIEFTLIYNRHKKPLLNYVYNLVRSKMPAEDIVHNSFIKLYDNFETIKNPESIGAWLYTTCRNEAYSLFKKNKQITEQDIEKYEDTALGNNLMNDFEADELGRLIEEELRKMSPEQSEAYILKVTSGFKYSEIGKIMGIEENLVRSRIFNVRQKLKIVFKYFEGNLK